MCWTKGCQQIHKTKQNRFFMECFTADILQLFTKMRQNLVFGWASVTRHHIQLFQRFS